MQFFNQYSFTIIAGTLLVIFSAMIFRRGIAGPQIVALLALFLGFMVAYSFFNPGESTKGGASRADQAIGSGMPTLLEFQSPY